MALRGAKRRELGDLKGQGTAPWQARGRKSKEGEAEFGRLKGVLERPDRSWALPPRLRRHMGKTDSNPQRFLTGWGLGAKGGGDPVVVFFFF